jgi:hypothetical protein
VAGQGSLEFWSPQAAAPVKPGSLTITRIGMRPISPAKRPLRLKDCRNAWSFQSDQHMLHYPSRNVGATRCQRLQRKIRRLTEVNEDSASAPLPASSLRLAKAGWWS